MLNNKEAIYLSPVSGKRTVRFETAATRPEIIHYQGADEKSRIRLALGNREYSFISRNTFVKRIMRNWRLFHDAEIPVVSTLRLDEENDILYTPDLTSDGSVFFGKGMLNLLEIHSYDQSTRTLHFRHFTPQLRKSHLDTRFCELWGDEKQKSTILDIARSIAKKASKVSLLLPDDDPFDLLIHPDGTYQLLVIDVALGGLLSEYEEVAFAPSQTIANVLGIESYQVTLDHIHNLSPEGKEQVVLLNNKNSVLTFEATTNQIFNVLSNSNNISYFTPKNCMVE